MKKERNQFVDIMRGIAMLLVVLGHTMTGCTVDSQQSFLFNIIWSLQMPLFILISGYVTKYSRAIYNINGLWKYVKRRTVAYMLPWCVWSFLVRGIMFGQKDFLNIKTLVWNMDSGYWFLATIWTISMIFGVSSFLAEYIGKGNELKKQLVLFGVYIIGMIILGGMGILLGLSFFAIKLTLYYMPFYYAGYLYGQYDEKILESKNGKRIVDFMITICFGIWLFVILRISLYNMSDSGMAIIMRAGTSLAGCIAVCGLCKGLFASKFVGGGSDLPINNHYKGTNNNYNPLLLMEKIRTFFGWAGKRSLEIYMIHGLLLNILRPHMEIEFSSIPGYFLTIGNFIITIGLCAIVIELLNQNIYLKKILSIR